jgi:hypothetical protein
MARVPAGVIVGVADGVALAPGLAVWVAGGVVIGLAEADAVRLGAKVGVEEAIALGVGVLVHAARSTARAKQIERGNEFTGSNSNSHTRLPPHGVALRSHG